MDTAGLMSGIGATPDTNPPEGDELKQLCLNQQTDDVNDEWENELKDTMPQEIDKIMDAICQRLSNDGVLKTCDADADTEDTVKLVDYMTNEAETLIREFISGNKTKISHHLLYYVPTLPKPMQSDGELPKDSKGIGVTDVAGVASGAENNFESNMPGATNVGSFASNDANITAPKKTTKYEIEDGDAKTILNHYTSHFIKLLKCDSNTAELLKTKIIDSMFISINDKLKIDKQELFGSIAKETTKHCIEKRIALIEPTIEVYKNIIKTVPEQILSNYLHLILELFVYNCYNYLLDSEKLGITPVDLSSHIQTLKKIYGINESLNGLTDNSVKKIMDLNKVPSPKTEKKDTEEQEEEEENNKVALKQFIKLFEEKKGGGKKKHTRKKKRHRKKRRSTRRYR